MTESVKSNDNQPLFIGSSCFPISPIDQGDEDIKLSIDDQLVKILLKVGIQNENKINFIKEKEVYEYMENAQ